MQLGASRPVRPVCLCYYRIAVLRMQIAEISKALKMKTPLSCLACLCLALSWSHSVLAQTESKQVSSDEIQKSLEQPATRGLGVRAKAKVDLNIPFEINSSELKPEAKRQLLQLEEALQRDELAGFRFAIVGHTDASGSAAYNRRLSEARAESVRQFLVDRGIDPDRLDATGRGEEELLYPDRPRHGANRRVEIKNLGER